MPIHIPKAGANWGGGVTMATSAYCGGCRRRVDLTPEGECPRGHLRSMLRDVRRGAVAPPAGAQGSGPVLRPADPLPAMSGSHEALAQVIGKSVVIVPAAAIIAFALWTGYESVAGEGVSVLQAILLSVGSLALTLGLAFAWAARRSGSH